MNDTNLRTYSNVAILRWIIGLETQTQLGSCCIYVNQIHSRIQLYSGEINSGVDEAAGAEANEKFMFMSHRS